MKILKSFRARLVFALILLAVSILLYFIIKSKTHSTTQNIGKDSTSLIPDKTISDTQTKPADLKYIQTNLDKDIDSILSCYGIKKEWITTFAGGQKNTSSKTGASKSKIDGREAQWFVKDVLIPKDLTSAEVNLDISLFVNNLGLLPAVNEDIKTKDIIIDIKKINDTTASTPLARIYITHSDKAVRENGTFCIIINNLGEYKKDEIDKILTTTNEFSFTFPRNLENIDLQNKLVQAKKDVIINLTLSSKDNSDADFISLDDKDIRQRVKSFTADFPGITKVLLTKADASPLPAGLMSRISEEFTKYNIIVISDSLLVLLLGKSDEDSKEKVNILTGNIKTKAKQTGKGISVINLSYEDFTKFYNEMLILKKLGYKFYNLSDYLDKESDKLKKEKQKDEKQKDEKLKSDKSKTDVKKENDKKDKNPKVQNQKDKPKKPNDKKK